MNLFIIYFFERLFLYVPVCEGVSVPLVGGKSVWAIPRYLDHLHREILFFWQKSLRTIYTYHLVPIKMLKNVQGGPFQGLLVF